MRNELKKTLLNILIALIVISIVLIVIISLNQEKKEKQKKLNLDFDIESSKYKGIYPDVVMIKGRIVTNSNQNQRVEIYYDLIFQYTSLNYIELKNPKIYIYDNNNNKTYYINSDIAYSESLDNIRIVTLKGNANIKNLLQNINIQSEMLTCDVESKQINTNLHSLVVKDGFNITSTGLYINEEMAIFNSDVKIKNKTGLYESKIVDEFVNLNGTSNKAFFNIKEKNIKLEGNAILVSNMLDIKGEQIQLFQYDDKNDENKSFNNRIYVIKGNAKYINLDKDIFYSIGSTIDYRQGKEKIYFLTNGNGYIKNNKENTYVYFAGNNVSFYENKDKKSTLKIENGYIYQKKINGKTENEIESQFYSKGDYISLIKEDIYKYNCKNGYGYIKNDREEQEVVFSGNNIDYVEKSISKITGNGNLFDFIGNVYVKGENLVYYEDKNIVTSDSYFFLRQFKKEFIYDSKDITKGVKPDFEKSFLNIKKDDYNLLVNDVSALKGKMNTETNESFLEGNVNIIDYENLVQIRSNYAHYSGKEEQIYYAEKNLFVYQYQSLEKILDKKYLSTIIESDKGTIYKKDDLAYFEGEPKIKNFEDNFFIKSDLLEAHLDTKVYVFKDNIKLLVNTSENRQIENQIYIMGQYAVYESNKKVITFSGPSILVQKNIELYVLEIFVDFNQKTINFKGIKDSKLQKIKF